MEQLAYRLEINVSYIFWPMLFIFPRLILSMDPRHGELSRAMRNRGVEVCLLEDDDLSGADSTEVDMEDSEDGQLVSGWLGTLLFPVYGFSSVFLDVQWMQASFGKLSLVNLCAF